MKPYETLFLAGQQRITIINAATALNTTPRRVKQMLSRWGDRLEVMKTTLEQLDREFSSRKEYSDALNSAAETLGITRRAVNQLLNHYEVPRNQIDSGSTRADRAETSDKAHERWSLTSRAALSVIAGADSMDTAAEQAEVSARQMYRWVTKLLDRVQVSLKDLKQMKLENRRRIANEIEVGDPT